MKGADKGLAAGTIGLLLQSMFMCNPVNRCTVCAGTASWPHVQSI